MLRRGGRFIASTKHWTHFLEVRAVEPLLDFVRSLGHDGETDAGALDAIRAHVERQIALVGSFHVSISAGVVQARKP